MKALHGIIRQFFEREEITYAQDANGAYRFTSELESDCRIRSCTTLLMVEKKRLQIVFELPFRIRRSECAPVVRCLAAINEKIHSYECFELDMLDGLIRYRLISEPPTMDETTDPDTLFEHFFDLIAFCLDNLESHVNSIIHVIFDDGRAHHSHSESSRSHSHHSSDGSSRSHSHHSHHSSGRSSHSRSRHSSGSHSAKRDGTFASILRIMGLVENDEDDD